MKPNTYEKWSAYVASELKVLTPILSMLGYSLDDRQPHISGERFLMQALTTTSGKKLILLGRERVSGMRVVIKATRDKAGMKELTHERACRIAIHTLPFAYHIFTSPQETFFGEREGFCISIQEFIEQASSFIERPIAEQFTFALEAFKAQEGAHAATYEQLRKARKVFQCMDAQQYLTKVRSFTAHAESYSDGLLTELYSKALTEMRQGVETIEQYGNFLTHTDFVPHNFRIAEGTLYLLDYSSIRFGNKHEGWARFLNFMALYNPELEDAFVQYFQENRAFEENESLHLMRVYRLTEIIWYYVRASAESSSALKTLNEARVVFWSKLLIAHLERSTLAAEVRLEYIKIRDALRSEEEQERQKGLH